jgi:hypothetical protein
MKPRLTVEIGFYATPHLQPVTGATDWFTLDTSQLDVDTVPSVDVWIDVTSRLRDQARFGRGRTEMLDRFQTGTAQFVLDNRDGWFDPLSALSPYAGSIEPLRPVRMFAEHEGFRTPVWSGFVRDWQTEYRPGGDGWVTVDCYDGFGLLAATELDPVVGLYGNDTPGQRISRLLDAPEVDYLKARDIDAGVFALAATDLGENTLDHLQQVAASDDGWLFVDRSGTLRFVDRISVLNRTSEVTFESGVDGDGVRLTDFVRDSSADMLFNRVTVETADGVRRTSTDAESVWRFQPRGLERRTLLVSPTDAELLADQLLSRFATPDQRVRQVTVQLHHPRQLNHVDRMLQLDVASRVRVRVSPPGVDGLVDRVMAVEQIVHHVTPETWTVQLWLGASDSRTFLQLDEPEFGQLDHNRVAF